MGRSLIYILSSRPFLFVHIHKAPHIRNCWKGVDARKKVSRLFSIRKRGRCGSPGRKKIAREFRFAEEKKEEKKARKKGQQSHAVVPFNPLPRYVEVGCRVTFISDPSPPFISASSYFRFWKIALNTAEFLVSAVLTWIVRCKPVIQAVAIFQKDAATSYIRVR